jgi:hypothetical protein
MASMTNDEKEMYLILHGWTYCIASSANNMYIGGKRYWQLDMNEMIIPWLSTDAAFRKEKMNNGLI